MRVAAATLLAVLAAVLAAAPAHADRETAEFQAARGAKALAAKEWSEAAELYRRSLDQDATFLPGRYGLAQALVGSGDSAAAIEELRGFIQAARAVNPLPADWKSLLEKAEKQLADIDAAGSALQAILDRHADDLVALAERWRAKDTKLAERALRSALKLRPGDAKAVKLLEKMGLSAAAPPIALFNGKDLTGWEFANPPSWQVIDGELVGNVRDAGLTIRSQRIFEGDYDVLIEARVVQEHPGPTLYAVLPSWKKDYDTYEFGCLDRKIVWFEKNGEAESRYVVETYYERLEAKKFEPDAWNVFELRFRGGTATALVNGEVVGEETIPETRRSGFVAVLVQDAKVAFRRVEVQVR